MRGVVEVWRGDEKILEGPNMLVDGAGALLADIMTVSPSLSGVEDQATSSILDTSNYMIQAMSFGTASQAFQATGRDVSFYRLQSIEQIVTTIQRAGNYNTAAFLTVSSNLPAPPTFVENTFFVESLDPSIPVLGVDTDVSSAIPIDGVDLAISSLFPGNGQHVNFMPSAMRNAMTDSTPFDVSAEVIGNLMGSFPAGHSERGSAGAGAFYINSKYGTQQGFALFANGSYPNEASSMDVSGFLTTAMSAVPDGSKNPMADLSSGLCLSAPAEQANEGFPFIEYSTQLSQDDLLYLNWFGGLFTLGLWTIDIKQSLLNGNTVPFGFSVLDNPRKYRLFCRKMTSKDLTYIDDWRFYEDLTIKWRIHFR